MGNCLGHKGYSYRPRILFVGMNDSIHVARWIELLDDLGWDLHLFPVTSAPTNASLHGVTLHWPLGTSQDADANVDHVRGMASVGRALSLAFQKRICAFRRLGLGTKTIEERPSVRTPLVETVEHTPVRIAAFHPSLEERGGQGSAAEVTLRLGESDIEAPADFGPGVLNSVIRRVQPHLIHSLEFQHSGYLVLRAKELFGQGFPKWLATNWGSDIFYFRRFPEHESQIRRLLASVDLYSCECERDWRLGREYGYSGPRLPMLTNSGGFKLDQLAAARSNTPPSKRKVLMIKGYQHFAGRGLTALRVLERFAARLKGFEIVMYSANAEPRRRASELREKLGLDIRVLDHVTNEEVLANFGRARLYMGISISDGISTSVLESMALGAFPIQTNTSCCGEWFQHGESGFIPSPDDFEQICACFERALTDDTLVDKAAAINQRTIERRLDIKIVRRRAKAFYDEALGEIAATGYGNGEKELTEGRECTATHTASSARRDDRAAQQT